jgi:hypothetical protein
MYRIFVAHSRLGITQIGDGLPKSVERELCVEAARSGLTGFTNRGSLDGCHNRGEVSGQGPPLVWRLRLSLNGCYESVKNLLTGFSGFSARA